MLAFKSDLRKIMLTVFKHNDSARKFFMDAMKFETDETCPFDDVYEQVSCCYSHFHQTLRLPKKSFERLFLCPWPNIRSVE